MPEREMSECAFPALIKKLTVTSLASGDKSGELLLWFRTTNELLHQINEIHVADAEVMIGIVPIDKTEKNYHAVQKGRSRKPKGKTPGVEV